MQIKCEFCGAFINDTDEVCPNCGGTNDNMKRSTDGTPKTIEELKAWYTARNLPPQEVTRFFIGVDYKEPRAFGIYRNGDEFVVYKNKDNGQRAVRYRGRDEAYAVNELFLKLKSEILNQKAHNMNNGNMSRSSMNNRSMNRSSINSGKKDNVFIGVAGVVILILLVVGIFSTIRDKKYKGYYDYGGQCYYCYSYDDWYIYDYGLGDYLPVTAPSELYDNYSDYRYNDSEVWSDEIISFEDSNKGSSVIASDSSSGDYDWDSGSSWDSGSTDWGSDW